MTINFEELATLDAAGALTPDEVAEFERALVAAPDDVRREIASLREVAATFAVLVAGETPADDVKARLLARVSTPAPEPPVPPGFVFRYASEDEWVPHSAPGIRVRVLSSNRERGYAMLLLDVAPGARFPAHHHGGAEECYVLSGSVVSCGRRLGPGDFHHADAGSDHEELWSEDGCRVLLVVDPRDYLPRAPR